MYDLTLKHVRIPMIYSRLKIVYIYNNKLLINKMQYFITVFKLVWAGPCDVLLTLLHSALTSTGVAHCHCTAGQSHTSPKSEER